MRKERVVLISLILCVALLCACSSAGGSTTTASTTAATTTVAANASAAATTTAASVAAEATTAATTTVSSASNYPTSSIEFMVPNAAGGGSDVLARLIERILRENNYVNQPIVVNNRPGGSGAVGFSYLWSKAGTPDNDYCLGIVTTTYWTTYLAGMFDYSWTEFTPVAHLAYDSLICVANKDLGISTMDELVNLCLTKPGGVLFAVGDIYANSALLTLQLRNAIPGATDSNVKIIPYEGSGETLVAILGGHSDITWISPSESADLITTGDLIPIFAATEERLPSFPDLPTGLELGYDVTLMQSRLVVGPANMSEEALAFWGDAFEKLYNTDEFQTYLSENDMVGAFVPPAEMVDYVDELGVMYAGVMSFAQMEMAE